MALWKISSRNNWNWGEDKQVVKGMFIEMTGGTTPPLGNSANRDAIAAAFNTKYSLSIEPSKINGSHFECEKIG